MKAKVQVRKSLMSMAVCTACAIAGPAAAFPGVLFDVNGADGPNTTVGAGADQIFVDSFDWGPGNTVAANAVPVKTAGSTNILLLSQSSLSALKFDSSNAAVQMAGTAELTFQMSANSKVVGGADPLQDMVFSNNIDVGVPVTFFRMYYDAGKDSSAVTGCGYGATQVALPGCLALSGETLILEGTVELVSMTWTHDAVQTTPKPLLDTNGIDNQSGVRTTSATGSAAYKVSVSFADPAFFLTNIQALGVTADLDHTGTNGDGFIPGTSNPSDQVAGRIMEDNTSGLTLTASLDASYGTGRINGDPTACAGLSGGADGRCDLHMVSDTSTGVLANVPEPGSVALMGLGLGLLGFGARRRRRA